jgi:hypothetical protein
MSSSTSDPATVPQAPAFSKDWWFRHALAFIVVGFSIVGIAVLSGIAIKGASAGTGRTEAIRLVFVSVLPLFGTWVGTVLAYYFARENLREATASVQAASAVTTEQLAKVWAPTTLVKDVMQPENRVERYVLKSSGTPPRQERVPNLELPELWKLPTGDLSTDCRSSTTRTSSRHSWPVRISRTGLLTRRGSSQMSSLARRSRILHLLPRNGRNASRTSSRSA